MEIPKEFFTIQSMLTLTGASGATYVVCNALQRAFNFNPKWLALSVAMLLSIYGTSETSQNRVSDYVIAIFNGFLIYLTAAGGTEATSGSQQNGGTAKGIAATPQPVAKRAFNTSWFR